MPAQRLAAQPRRLMIFIGRRRLQAVLGGLSIAGSAASNPFLDWINEVVTGRATPTGGPIQSIASSRLLRCRRSLGNAT
jgi:hypothetical protein